MKTNLKTNLIIAHPNLDGKDTSGHYFPSKINSRLAGLFEKQNSSHLTITKLYEVYPNFKIDVKAEQQKLLDSELTIFAYPLYWYSVPPLMKLWFDAVLEHGFAYGTGGDKLKGKDMMHIVTIGGPEHAYKPNSFNHFRMTDLLHPQEQTAYLCGMNWHEPCLLHGSHNVKQDDVDRFFELIQKRLADM